MYAGSLQRADSASDLIAPSHRQHSVHLIVNQPIPSLTRHCSPPTFHPFASDPGNETQTGEPVCQCEHPAQSVPAHYIPHSHLYSHSHSPTAHPSTTKNAAIDPSFPTVSSPTPEPEQTPDQRCVHGHSPQRTTIVTMSQSADNTENANELLHSTRVFLRRTSPIAAAHLPRLRPCRHPATSPARLLVSCFPERI